MASKSLCPWPVAGESITWAAASRSSLFSMLSGSASLPSASRTISSFSRCAKLNSESLMFFTAVAFSNHSRTLAGLFFICCSKSSNMALFSLLELAVVRFRLSSTIEKPLSTSVEMFKASIAMRTTYIRLIIFWRGEAGLFLIAIGCGSYRLGFAARIFTVMASIMRA